MKFSATIAAIVSLSLALALGGPAGCKKSVNGNHPTIQNTVRVSLASNGAEGNLDCVNEIPGISNDGRYIVFGSKATNLVPGDTNNCADVFFRDNLNRTLTLVSTSFTGGFANGASGTPSISGDGRYVAFSSVASNLVAIALPPGVRQIYVRDMQTGTTTLVSRASGASGLIADANCDNPRISNDGNYVVFESLSNLLDGVIAGGDDNDLVSDIYRRKWLDGTSAFPTDLISLQSGFGQGVGKKGTGSSNRPAISADGTFVAFDSTCADLVSATQDGAPDSNSTTDVFVRDTGTNRTVRCSVEFAGSNPLLAGISRSASISLDGQLVAFRSLSGTLHPAAQEVSTPNIFLRSWAGPTPFTEVLSVHTSGATGGQNCDRPSISGDGSKIAWQSPSSALVNGDSNNADDIFLRNRTTLETSRESVQTFGGQLDGNSNSPAFSADGRYIVFWSKATNVVDDDTNGAADFFLRGPPFK